MNYNNKFINNQEMKKIIMLFMLTFVAGMAGAQNSIVSIDEVASMMQDDVTLENKSAVVFISKRDNIIVTSSANNDVISPTRKMDDGRFATEVTCAMEKGGDRSRTFGILIQGTTLKGEKKKTLAAGKRFYFDVEAAEHMLGLLYPETRDILYPVEGKTCIVFNIPPDINNLKVECSNQLRGKTEATSENGVNVLSLELDANVLKEYIAIVDNAQQQLIEKNNAFNALRAEINAKASDPKYDIDAAEAREKAMKSELEQMQKEAPSLFVRLTGESSNTVYVDVAKLRALGAKAKLTVNVTDALHTEKVFTGKFEEMLSQANTHRMNRDYKLAKQYYESAAQASDASATDKQTAMESATKMEELNAFKDETDQLAGRLYEITRNNQRVNKDQLHALIDDISERYRTLHLETKDQFYLDEANRLQAEKSKIGFVLKGRFVMSEYKGGSLQEVPITNVRIYGSQASNSDEMDSPKFSRKGEIIETVTAADGHFSLNLHAGEYKTIIFEAIGNKDIKINKHVSVEGRTDDRNVKIRFPKD